MSASAISFVCAVRSLILLPIQLGGIGAGMRPSPLAQVVMLAAFFAVMGGVWWFAHKLVHEWLPIEIVTAAVAIMAPFLASFVFASDRVRRDVLKRVQGTPMDPQQRSIVTERLDDIGLSTPKRSFWRLVGVGYWTIIHAAAALIFVGSIAYYAINIGTPLQSAVWGAVLLAASILGFVLGERSSRRNLWKLARSVRSEVGVNTPTNERRQG